MSRDQNEAVVSREGAWHQSKISTLIDICARQYGLEYVLKLPTGARPWSSVGTAYHAGCELHENARLAGEATPTYEQQLEVALAHLEKDIAELPADAWKHDQPDDLRVQVTAATYHFWHSKTKIEGQTIREFIMEMTPVSIEGYFRVPLVDGTLPIGGWFDGLYQKKDGSYTLIDHKTAASFSNWPLSGEGHRTQAAFYSAALVASEDYPMITDLIPMEYLIVRKATGTSRFEGSRIVSVVPDLADISLLGYRTREAQRIVETEDYEPNPASTLCSAKFCPFYSECEGARGDITKGNLWMPWPEVKKQVIGLDYNQDTVIEVNNENERKYND